MRLKAAMHSPVSAASVPPATTASASPRTIIRVASPIACPPVAHALETLKPGPWAPRRIAIVPAAALGIIIGTKCGETARSPPSSHAWHSFCRVLQAAHAGAHEHAEALGVDAVGQAGLLGRLHGRGHRELRVAVAAARLLGRHGDLGIEVDARADAVGDARALAQQGLEEGVGPLADRRDDAPSGDDDLRHADAPAFSRVSSCTSAAASPTVAIDFSRPSAICTS